VAEIVFIPLMSSNLVGYPTHSSSCPAWAQISNRGGPFSGDSLPQPAKVSSKADRRSNADTRINTDRCSGERHNPVAVHVIPVIPHSIGDQQGLCDVGRGFSLSVG
jgi:hypothetical protein